MAPLPPGWILRPGTLVLADSVLEALSALLAQAPPGVQGVVAEGAQLGAFWTERGEAAQVEALAVWLEALRAFHSKQKARSEAPHPAL